jgi:MPBQ/MSBQ methyltransferase
MSTDGPPSEAEGSARRTLARRYERKVLDPRAWAEFGGSGFYDVGLWGPDTHDQASACEALVDRVAAGLPPRPRLLLDVACGAGATTERLRTAAHARVALGIDVTAAFVGVARRRFPSCSFAIMDATAPALADGSVDAVTCIEAAFHFRSRRRFLGQAARVLRPGGRLVLTDLVVADADLLGRWMAPVENDLASDDYAGLVAAAGFDEVSVVDSTEECWHAYCRAAGSRTSSPVLQRHFDALADGAVQAYLLVTATRSTSATPPAPQPQTAGARTGRS